MCWFPTPPAMLKPSPAFTPKRGAAWSAGCRFLFGVCVCCATFGSFDEFDLEDGLYHGPAAPNIQANDRACDLQGLHCSAVRDLRHVCVVNPQNAVVHSGRQSSNSTTSMLGRQHGAEQPDLTWALQKSQLEWQNVRKIKAGPKLAQRLSGHGRQRRVTGDSWWACHYMTLYDGERQRVTSFIPNTF